MMRTVIGFVAACFVVGPIAYLLADREPPFVRLNGSKLVPSEVHPGDYASVHWDLHVNTHRACIPIGGVYRYIIDNTGKVTTFEPVPSTADVGNRRITIDRNIRIPMGLVDGPARYHAEACFACNPLQEFYPICITSPDIEFTVLPNK